MECLLYIILAVFVSGSTSQHWPDTTTAASTTINQMPVNYSTTTNQMPVNYCDRQYSCLNCTTTRVCAPTGDGITLYEIDRVTCPQDAPWCDFDTGTCSYQESDACTNPPTTSDFPCMRDGFFPDPNNCSRYYECRNDKATMYTCPESNPYYSAIYATCYSYSGYCTNGSSICHGLSGVKAGIGWSTNDGFSYFLYCDNNTAIAVDRCIGANVFVSYHQRCEPSCPFRGLYPDQDSCSNYYKCSPVSLQQIYTYTLTNMTCPEGQAFSETEYQCVDRSLVSNCYVRNSDLFDKR